MIVVDTNIIGYLYLSSEHSAEAEQALLKDPHWAAPLLWRSELRSVLMLYLRKKLLGLEDALQIMDEATHLMQDGEYEVASLQVLRLAAESTCSAYNCEFIALSKTLDVPLVTVDKQILAQFPDQAVSLETFLVD
jgi:predicted nucleic acid-binding protein